MTEGRGENSLPDLSTSFPRWGRTARILYDDALARCQNAAGKINRSLTRIPLQVGIPICIVWIATRIHRPNEQPDRDGWIGRSSPSGIVSVQFLRAMQTVKLEIQHRLEF